MEFTKRRFNELKENQYHNIPTYPTDIWTLSSTGSYELKHENDKLKEENDKLKQDNAVYKFIIKLFIKKFGGEKE